MDWEHIFSSDQIRPFGLDHGFTPITYVQIKLESLKVWTERGSRKRALVSAQWCCGDNWTIALQSFCFSSLSSASIWPSALPMTECVSCDWTDWAGISQIRTKGLLRNGNVSLCWSWWIYTVLKQLLSKESSWCTSLRMPTDTTKTHSLYHWQQHLICVSDAVSKAGSWQPPVKTDWGLKKKSMNGTLTAVFSHITAGNDHCNTFIISFCWNVLILQTSILVISCNACRPAEICLRPMLMIENDDKWFNLPSFLTRTKKKSLLLDSSNHLKRFNMLNF